MYIPSATLTGPLSDPRTSIAILDVLCTLQKSTLKIVKCTFCITVLYNRRVTLVDSLSGHCTCSVLTPNIACDWFSTW